MDKKIVWLEHARENLTDREIPEAEVLRTLESAQWTEKSYAGRRVLMNLYFDSILNQEMLLRVVIQETAKAILVVTLYKTSNIARYIRRDK